MTTQSRGSTLAGYQSAKDAAERIGIDDSQVRKLAAADRLPGATKFGNLWFVPEESWPTVSNRGRPARWSARGGKDSLRHEAT